MRNPSFIPCLALVVALMTGGNPATAQVVPAADTTRQVVTLDQVVAMAASRNLDLAQAQNNASMAGVSVSEARAAYLPDLSVSVSPNSNFSRGSGQGSATGLSTNASASVTVFDAGARRAGLSQARIEQDAVGASVRRTAEQIQYRAATQYVAVLQAQEVVRVQEENLAAQEQQLAQIEAFYKAGNRSLADVLQQRATIAQSRMALTTARENAASALLNLKQTLNLSPATPLVPAALDTTRSAGTPAQLSPVLLEQAVEQRTDVAAQRMYIDAARSGVRSAQAGYYPSISLGVGAGTSYSSANDLNGFGGQLFDTNPNASVGFSLRIPILDQRRTRSSVERAQISLGNEQLALESAEQQVRYETEQAVLTLNSTRTRLDAAEAQLAAATEALKAAQERYRVGASTFAELADAQRLHVDAAGEVAQARYQILIDELGVGYAVGDLQSVLNALR